MDPLTIATATTALLATIGRTTVTITTFVRSVRDARKDLEAICRELASLRLSLETLSDDLENPAIEINANLEKNLRRVLGSCETVVGKIEELLVKMLGAEGGVSGGVKGIEWSVTVKGDVDRLRGGLEAHKMSLDLVLDLVVL